MSTTCITTLAPTTNVAAEATWIQIRGAGGTTASNLATFGTPCRDHEQLMLLTTSHTLAADIIDANPWSELSAEYRTGARLVYSPELGNCTIWEAAGRLVLAPSHIEYTDPARHTRDFELPEEVELALFVPAFAHNLVADEVWQPVLAATGMTAEHITSMRRGRGGEADLHLVRYRFDLPGGHHDWWIAERRSERLGRCWHLHTTRDAAEAALHGLARQAASRRPAEEILRQPLPVAGRVLEEARS